MTKTAAFCVFSKVLESILPDSGGSWKVCFYWTTSSLNRWNMEITLVYEITELSVPCCRLKIIKYYLVTNRIYKNPCRQLYVIVCMQTHSLKAFPVIPPWKGKTVFPRHVDCKCHVVSGIDVFSNTCVLEATAQSRTFLQWVNQLTLK